MNWKKMRAEYHRNRREAIRSAITMGLASLFVIGAGWSSNLPLLYWAGVGALLFALFALAVLAWVPPWLRE